MNSDDSSSISLKSYILRGVSGILIIRVLGTGLALILSIVFARLMGPTEFGLYSFAIETMKFITISVSMGFPILLIREVAKLKNRREYKKLKGILLWASQFVTILGITVIGIAILIIKFQVEDPYKSTILLLALPLILLNGLAQTWGGALRGLRRPVLSQLAITVLRPGLTLSFILLGYWIFSISIDARIGILAMCGALFVSLLLNLNWLLNSLPHQTRVRNTKALYNSRKWIREAWPFFLLGGVGLINSRLGIILTGVFLESEKVGYLKIAVTAATLISFFLFSVNSTIAPLISELHSKGHMDKLQRILTKTVQAVFALSFSVASIYFLFGRQLITVFYGQSYTQAYMPLVFLSIGQVINAGAGSVGYVLNMTGHQKKALIGQTISALSAVIISLILIPTYGINGAAIATSISMVVWNIILIRMLSGLSQLKTTIF